MAYYVVIIDKDNKKLSTKSGADMDDRGSIRHEDTADFSVTEVPGTVTVPYHKSYERTVDFLENVTVTNLDTHEITVSDEWEIKVVETSPPLS